MRATTSEQIKSEMMRLSVSKQKISDLLSVDINYIDMCFKSNIWKLSHIARIKLFFKFNIK